jgi:hypothetical protein
LCFGAGHNESQRQKLCSHIEIDGKMEQALLCANFATFPVRHSSRAMQSEHGAYYRLTMNLETKL